MAGRPTKYTEALADEICRRIAEGESLNRVCKDPKMPAESTVRAWAIDPDHPISAKYARAREMQAHHYADRIADVATNAETGDIDPKAAQAAMHGYEWVAGKLSPRNYGQKIQQEVTQTTHYKVHHEDDVKGAL